MKRNIIAIEWAFILISICLMSCNKTEDVKTVDSQRSPILSFSSEEDFFDAVKSIKQGVQTKTLINQLNKDAAFISLYH